MGKSTLIGFRALLLTLLLAGSAAAQIVTGGGSVAVGGGLDQTTNPLSFGAKWDVRFEGDCTFNTTTTVVCPSGAFTSADVGKIEFGTCGTTQVNPAMITAGGLVVPQGTIQSITNGTTVVVSIAATANCTPSTTVAGTFAWGTADDTTAINNAAAAAWNSTSATCTLQFPAGAAFFSAAILNGPASNKCMGGTTNGALSDTTSAGPVVYGQGPGTTVLIPLPSFNFASCTFGAANQTCIGGLGNLHAHDFAINGLQQLIGGTHNVNLFEARGVSQGGGCDGGTTTWNLYLSTWALTSAGTTGFLFGNQMCNDASMWNINVSAFGSQPCHALVNGNTLNAYGLYCIGAGAASTAGNVLELDATGSFAQATFNSFGGQYLSPLLTANAAIHCFATGNGLTFNSWGDVIGFGGGTAPAQVSGVICNGQSANLNFHGSNITVPSTTTGTSQAFFLNGGNVVHLQNTVVNATGTNNRIFSTAASDKVFDDGGNTFTNGTVANSISGSFFGGYSASGVVQTAGNFADGAGLGTSTFGTITGDSRHGQVTVTYAGALTTTPAFTMTFPTSFLVAPSCTLLDVGGTNAFPTAIANGAISTTSAVFNLTFAVAPTAGNTDIFVWNCSN